MLKNKKILIILLLSILLIGISSSNVFGVVSTSAGDYTDFPFPINEETYEIVLVNHGSWTSNDHWFAFPKGQGLFYMSDNILSYYNNTSNSVTVYYGDAHTNSISVYKSPSVSSKSSVNWSELGVDSSKEGNYNTDGLRHIIYTNSIVYTSLEGYKNNDIFFRATPLQGVQVVEITQVEEIPKAITQILKTIIPIGLLILSIFLGIFLIRLVILRQA